MTSSNVKYGAFVFNNKLNTSDAIMVKYTTSTTASVTILANMDHDQFKYGCATKHEMKSPDGATRIHGVQILCEQITNGADTEKLITNFQGTPIAHTQIKLELDGRTAKIDCPTLSKMQKNRLEQIWQNYSSFKEYDDVLKITPMQFSELLCKTMYGASFSEIHSEIVCNMDSNVYHQLATDEERLEHIRNSDLKEYLNETVGEYLYGIIDTYDSKGTMF